MSTPGRWVAATAAVLTRYTGAVGLRDLQKDVIGEDFSAIAKIRERKPLHGLWRSVTICGWGQVGMAVTKIEHKAKSRRKPRRGRPKQSGDGVKARGRLLDAAESLFAERGFYGVTTRQVADAAGVDVAVIYHFKNKSSLFDGVFERRARTGFRAP